jgi:hypothetical protein
MTSRRESLNSGGVAPRDLVVVIRAEVAEVRMDLGLRLTYQPNQWLVRAEVHISPAQHWQFDSVRGPSAPKSQYVVSGEFALGGQR